VAKLYFFCNVEEGFVAIFLMTDLLSTNSIARLSLARQS
jgi:hypothetical protein